MSTNTAKSPVSAPTPNLDATKLDEGLERRIEETRRLVLRVDLWLSLLILATILFGGLLLAVLADHWLFKDGLSGPMRYGIFGGLILVAGLYVYRRIVPLLLYPINPVYAASVLEQGSPTLKNSLLNWILLRQERLERGRSTQDRLSERMYDGVTRSAASGVATVPTERAVDLRGVGRWSIVLAVLFLFFIVYSILSPKSPLTSLARIILPMSGIDRPQAVRFLDIQPGNAVFRQGEKTVVSVEVVSNSLNVSEEPVYLFFSTDDGQAVRQAIPMSLPAGKNRFEAPFPPGKQGFVSGVEYWIGQGESRSGTFRIEVRPVASIEVASLTYEYPTYTGREGEIVENSGDIRAVEGTEVRVHAKSTLPLERMDILFENDSSLSTPMRILKDKPNEAVTSLILERDAKDEASPTIRHYTFRAVDAEGFESRRSGVFRVEILPDRSPVVQWGESQQNPNLNLNELAELELPVNGSLELPIQAEDPDFALRYLRFHVDVPNRTMRSVELVKSAATGPTDHTGPIKAKTVFLPQAYRMVEGDSADIWAEAVDSKYPDANSATTRRIKIIIGKAQEQPPQEDPQPNPQEDPQNNKEEEPNKDDQRTEKQKNDGETEDSRGEGDTPKGEEAGDTQENQDKAGSGEDSANDKSQGGKSEENKHDEAGKNVENDGMTPSEGQDDPSGGDNEQNADGGENGNAENREQPGGGDRQENRNGEQGEKEENGQNDENQPQDRVDPETQGGDAMERIREQMRKENKLPDDEELMKQAEQERQKQDGEPKDQEHKESCPDGQCGQCKSCQNGNKQGGRSGEEGQNAGGNGQGNQDQNGDGGEQGNQNQNASGGEQGNQGQNAAGGGNDQQGSGNAQNGQEQKAGEDDRGEGEQTGGNDPGGDGNGRETDDPQTEGPTGGGSEKSPGKENGGDAPAGGDRAGDPDSSPSSKSGDNRNSDGENLPVDPSDKTPRERSDGLDPNSQDRRQQGSNSDNPRQQDKTDFNHASKSGDGEGKGEETTQTGQSDTLQNADQGQRGKEGTEGVEQDGGSEARGNSKTGFGEEQEESQNGEKGASPSPSGGQEGQPGQEDAGGESPQSGQPGQSKQPGEQGRPGQSPGSPEGPQGESSDLPGQTPGGSGGPSVANADTAVENPNEKYSEQVTNLVLEYLEDQLKEKPSEELLTKLGWSEQELRDWHRKWKAMAEQGREARPGTPENEQWKENLRSLGVKPDRQRTKRSRSDFQDQESATEIQRFAPPPGLEGRSRTYSKEIAK